MMTITDVLIPHHGRSVHAVLYLPESAAPVPAEAPKPAYERKPRSDSRLRPKHGHRSEPQRHSNPSHKSVSHDRGGYAR